MRLVGIEAKLLNPIEEAAAEAAFNARIVDARVPEWDGCREAGARKWSAGGGGVAACRGGEAFGDVHGVRPRLFGVAGTYTSLPRSEDDCLYARFTTSLPARAKGARHRHKSHFLSESSSAQPSIAPRSCSSLLAPRSSLLLIAPRSCSSLFLTPAHTYHPSHPAPAPPSCSSSSLLGLRSFSTLLLLASRSHKP